MHAQREWVKISLTSWYIRFLTVASSSLWSSKSKWSWEMGVASYDGATEEVRKVRAWLLQRGKFWVNTTRTKLNLTGIPVKSSKCSLRHRIVTCILGSSQPQSQSCSVRFFESKGAIKFVNVLEPSNCSSSFDVQFRKWRILLVSEVILVQNMLELL